MMVTLKLGVIGLPFTNDIKTKGLIGELVAQLHYSASGYKVFVPIDSYEQVSNTWTANFGRKAND